VSDCDLLVEVVRTQILHQLAKGYSVCIYTSGVCPCSLRRINGSCLHNT